MSAASQKLPNSFLWAKKVQLVQRQVIANKSVKMLGGADHSTYRGAVRPQDTLPIVQRGHKTLEGDIEEGWDRRKLN